MIPAALGFRAHSGWAAAVALAGDSHTPQVVARQRIEMADRPEARQPYHAAEGLKLEKARRLLGAFSRRAEALACRGLDRLLEDLKARGYAPRRIAILQASGRLGASLEATLASHALIHTADGEHFREALAHAAGRAGLEVVRVPERDLEGLAVATLGLSPEPLRGRIAALGRELGPPWTVDQKAATLAAWLLLAGGAGRARPQALR
jgi:hypothetical protein